MNLPLKASINAEAFLAPIENPRGLIMRFVYATTRRRFGKVLTPLSVFAARLPPAFGTFYGKVSSLDRKLVLSPEIAILIRQRVAQINVCSFCSDIGRWYAIKNASMTVAKLDALDEYHTNPLFTGKERAALDYATELTQHKTVSRETFERLANECSEREICEIAWLVASEHLYNISNLGMNIHSDRLCSAMYKIDKTDAADETIELQAEPRV